MLSNALISIGTFITVLLSSSMFFYSSTNIMFAKRNFIWLAVGITLIVFGALIK